MKKQNRLSHGAREDIKSLLRQAVALGSSFYKDERHLFLQLIDLFEKHHLTGILPYENYRLLLKETRRMAEAKVSDAVDYFVSQLDIPVPETNSRKIITFHTGQSNHFKKPKGQKQTRGPKWVIAGQALDAIIRLKQNRTDELAVLCKAYWVEHGMTDYYFYICDLYGITPDRLSEPDVQEDLKRKDEWAGQFVESLRKTSETICSYLDDHKAKVWIVDVFGESAARYIKDWQRYRRQSHNRPNYKKSFDRLVAFLRGKSAAKAGVVDYPKFYREVGPQGLVVLLKKIHRILYFYSEWEGRIMREKISQINCLFEALPRSLYRMTLHVANELAQNPPQLGAEPPLPKTVPSISIVKLKRK